MLDLDPPVQLEEEEVAAVEDELGGARAPVRDRPGEGDRGVAHRRAQLRIEGGGGRLFEHLLVAPLDRALALAEGDGAAVPVTEKLDLDVAWPLEEALAEDAVVPEGGLRLPACGVQRIVELRGRADDAHPAAAAARGRLHDQREAERRRIALLEDRDAGLAGGPLRGELVAARLQRLRRRADEHQACGLHRRREGRVLREKAVAGMDRVRAGDGRRADVLLGVQV